MILDYVTEIDKELSPRERVYSYVETEINKVDSKLFGYHEDYELPSLSSDFVLLVNYIEYLIKCREEHFSFDTELRFYVEDGDQEKFNEELTEMITVMSSVDSFLANTNDSGFLADASYLIDREWNCVNKYVQHHDMFGEDNKYKDHRLLRDRLYEILQGRDTRISDLIRSNGFSVTITPYHENLDVACNAILIALKNIAPELQKRGIIFHDKLVTILSEGPRHERAHHEAYINYKPERAEGRRNMLIEGRSGLGEWIHFNVDLQIRRQGNTIVAGMTADIPHTGSLDETVHIYLAPETPSLGDVLLTSREILRGLPQDNELYREVVGMIGDISEELRLFDEDEFLPDDITEEKRGGLTADEKRKYLENYLVSNIRNFYYGEEFVVNRLIRNIRQMDDVFARSLVKTIKKHFQTVEKEG